MYKITKLTPQIKRPAFSMADEEIVSWLRRFQYSQEFRDKFGTHEVPLTCFCDFAGVDRSSVYRFMRGERTFSIWYKQRLSEAISAVRAGLRWRRQGDHSYVVNNPELFKSFPKYERARRSA